MEAWQKLWSLAKADVTILLCRVRACARKAERPADKKHRGGVLLYDFRLTPHGFYPLPKVWEESQPDLNQFQTCEWNLLIMDEGPEEASCLFIARFWSLLGQCVRAQVVLRL